LRPGTTSVVPKEHSCQSVILNEVKNLLSLAMVMMFTEADPSTPKVVSG